jgi:RNA-directed DNA polymerase
VRPKAQLEHRVNHDRLMARIAKRVDDKRLLKLIRAFLNAGVTENGPISPSVEGTPQGGPLSPLLSNVVLDELDRDLERRGHRHVRYADDCNIYVCSERAGHRVMKSIRRFITQRLKLKVNETKSAVARPQERKFLGFSFTSGPEIRRAIAPKALTRFKDKIRGITRQAKGISIETTVKRLATYMVGWRGYFGFCETPEVLIGLIRWVRLRLRCALWRQWKTPRRRRAALLQLGYVRVWPSIRPVVDAALGTWPAPKLYQWELRMHTSARSAFLRYSRTASVTSRTAVYGPVRTVVWQGAAGDCRPYADQTPFSLRKLPDGRKPFRYASE